MHLNRKDFEFVNAHDSIPDYRDLIRESQTFSQVGLCVVVETCVVLELMTSQYFLLHCSNIFNTVLNISKLKINRNCTQTVL